MFVQNEHYILIGNYIICDPSLVHLVPFRSSTFGNSFVLCNVIGDVKIPIPPNYVRIIQDGLELLKKNYE